MKIKLLILALIAQVANIAMAYTISGTVTANGEPMPGVVITRIGVGNGEDDVAYAVTDIDGHYTVDSGTKDNIMLIASFSSYMSQLKMADSSVVNFDLEQTPKVPVQFFMNLLDQKALVEFLLTAQLKSMGISDYDFNMYLSGNDLIFSIMTDKYSKGNNNFDAFHSITIKGYLQQMKAEGSLETFLTQMQASGMKWVFGVYSKPAMKWLYYKEYDAKQIRKLL